ncbi:MAG: SDR family oxidoreductase [Thermoguttaceae bacterium]|jgi:NAD(P)-dependent dehydrogenase (short-subunit alcohol dehydrogenase family)
MDIPGKVAVITGAGSGIGEAVALELVRRGIKAVALVDQVNGVSHLAESIDQFTHKHAQTVAYVGDVTDEAFRRQVYDEVTSRWGVPRICVPAAGITRDSLAAKIDRETGKAQLYPLEDFRRVLEINLLAPIYWALEMVGRIAEDRHTRGQGRWLPEEHIQGTVVLIGSVSSRGNKGQISYAATKAGLEGAAATLTLEAMYHGVRCGVIHPGYTDTPMVHALGDDFIQQRILPHTQLGRLIRPEEIADAICFMIGNSAVSGELWADAGWAPSA